MPRCVIRSGWCHLGTTLNGHTSLGVPAQAGIT
jgi:hypothetical protein